MFNKVRIHDWWETHLEIPTIFVAFLFLASLVIPSAYSFDSTIKSTFTNLELFLWSLFTLEYIVRVAVSGDRWYFIKRHPIDLLVIIIPFAQGLRILRIIALTAYFVRKARNLFITKNILFLISMAPLMLTISGVLMYEAESKAKGTTIKTFWDSLWWAVATMSTVGYGDKYPVTSAGKVIATLTIIVGVSLLGMLTAEIAVIFIGSREQEADRDKENFDKVMNKLESMEKEILELKNRPVPGEDDIKP